MCTPPYITSHPLTIYGFYVQFIFPKSDVTLETCVSDRAERDETYLAI